jgi:hypothetical protein
MKETMFRGTRASQYSSLRWISYLEQGKMDDVKVSIQEAIRLEPNEKQYQNLIQQITVDQSNNN